MRFIFIYKPSNRQFDYENELSALESFKRMFGADLNWIVLRSLVGMCITNFTFENEKFILKGYKDD